MTAGQAHRFEATALYYLEMPPSLFAPIVENLAKAGLLERARVAVEKPFGHDLKSARELNARLRAVFDEDQIFRVDHFLGKEPVVELEYLRFGNLALAELWVRHAFPKSRSPWPRTSASTTGASSTTGRRFARRRAKPSAAGARRSGDGAPGRAERGRPQRQKSRRIARDTGGGPRRSVRGQYHGYTDIDGVAKDSQTETFVALRVEIDNWRWAGVPIFLRAGKALTERVTEVRCSPTASPR